MEKLHADLPYVLEAETRWSLQKSAERNGKEGPSFLHMDILFHSKSQSMVKAGYQPLTILSEGSSPRLEREDLSTPLWSISISQQNPQNW